MNDDLSVRPPISRVMAEFRPHKKLARRGVMAGVLTTLFSSLSPLVIGSAIDKGIVPGNGRWVATMVITYTVIVAGQGAAVTLQAIWMGRFAQDYMRDLRTRMLDHLLEMDLDFFGRERSGRLVSRMTSDVENLQQFVGGGLSLIVEAALVLVLTIALMLALSPALTLAALMIVPPLALATRAFQRHAFEAQVGVRDSVASLMTRLNESLVGMRVVQAYAVEEVQRRAFDEVNQDTYDAKMKMTAISVRYYPIVEFLNPVALAAVLSYGAILAASGKVQVGTVVAFTLYVGRLFQPIQQFTELAQLIQAASASFSKVFSFMDEKPMVVDSPNAHDLNPGPGQLTVEDISFRYNPEGPDVIRNVSVALESGERIAIVGESGAGKSTMAKLVARFYDPTSGRVLLDGQDLREVKAISLRRQVALVPQEGFLFDGTIAENVAAANPGVSRDEIERASDLLGLSEAISKMPDGLDTVIRNRGLSLSSGQRQLVALARAFVASPAVLILDEATSNLDPATEVIVEEAMEKLLEGRTAIVIAHRLRTAIRADRVLLFDDGQLIECDSPASLMARDSAFARLVEAADDPALEDALSRARGQGSGNSSLN